MAANSNSNVQQPFSITVNCHPHPLGLLNPGNEGWEYTCTCCKFMDGGRRYSCRTCNDYNMHIECAIRVSQVAAPTTTPAPSSSHKMGNLATIVGAHVVGSVAGHQINNVIDAKQHATRDLAAGQSTTVDPTTAASVNDCEIVGSGVPNDGGGALESIIEFISNFI